MTVEAKTAKLSRAQIRAKLWAIGDLSWVCNSVQKDMRDRYYNASPNSTSVWLLARQSGKSYLIAILALEEALRNPNAVIKIATDTKVHLENILIPIFNEIFAKFECPKEVTPKYYKHEFKFVFPHNQAQIQFAGTDSGHYEKLRGQKSQAVFIDEAGFCNDLHKVVTSVLLPTTTHTGGKIVLASTPPENLDHDFMGFIERSQGKNLLTTKTIFDNPMLTKVQIETLKEEAGGEQSDSWKREYLCQLLKDTNKSVIPEATEEFMRDVIKVHPKPPFIAAYAGMDLGFKDLTVYLLGYYDFRADTVVYYRELTKKGPELDLNKLGNEFLAIEKELLYTESVDELTPMCGRVSDINYIVTEQIRQNTNGRVFFDIPEKDGKFTAVNAFRAALASGRIIIDPSCVTLIHHLKNAKWKDKSKSSEFARSPDNHHYDAVDAALYLYRSINFSKNPYPPGYGRDLNNLYVRDKSLLAPKQPGQMDMLRKLFSPGKKQ